MIWFKDIQLDELNAWHLGSMQEFVGIRFTAVGPDSLTATMPVTERTRQPQGLLHGGANVVLAESLGSVASVLCIDPEESVCVGLEVNANHIRSVRSGLVTGIARPLHLGRSTQVWEIRITNEEGQLCCVSRLTNAILQKKA